MVVGAAHSPDSGRGTPRARPVGKIQCYPRGNQPLLANPPHGTSVCWVTRDQKGAGYYCIRHGDAACSYRVVVATAVDITEWHMGQG